MNLETRIHKGYISFTCSFRLFLFLLFFLLLFLLLSSFFFLPSFFLSSSSSSFFPHFFSLLFFLSSSSSSFSLFSPFPFSPLSLFFISLPSFFHTHLRFFFFNNDEILQSVQAYEEYKEVGKDKWNHMVCDAYGSIVHLKRSNVCIQEEGYGDKKMGER